LTVPIKLKSHRYANPVFS